jgi:hypothetical protein
MRRPVLSLNGAGVCLHDPLRYSKTQASAFTGARPVRAIEAIEDAREIVRRDAGPGVGDLQSPSSSARIEPDGHFASGGSMFQSVVEQDKE